MLYDINNVRLCNNVNLMNFLLPRCNNIVVHLFLTIIFHYLCFLERDNNYLILFDTITHSYHNHYSCSKISTSYASLESAMIKFLSRCCWCHLANQKLLARLLTEVISQQRTTSSKYI